MHYGRTTQSLKRHLNDNQQCFLSLMGSSDPERGGGGGGGQKVRRGLVVEVIISKHIFHQVLFSLFFFLHPLQPIFIPLLSFLLLPSCLSVFSPLLSLPSSRSYRPPHPSLLPPFLPFFNHVNHCSLLILTFYRVFHQPFSPPSPPLPPSSSFPSQLYFHLVAASLEQNRLRCVG